MKFLQEATSADVFGLGIIMLQIATGCPSQLALPIKVRCKSVNNRFYVTTPHFGHCQSSMIDEKYVLLTIKMQEKLINNLDFFLKKTASADHYNLLKDKNF